MALSKSSAKRAGHPSLLLLLLLLLFSFHFPSNAIEILSKSKLERCVKTSDSDNMSCEKKVVINIVVPSGSSGGEASIVSELVEVEENDTQKMQTIRVPPIITINKSAAYALYDLSYLRDVAYKPEEFYVQTRKCEPDASSRVVKICERLRDQDGHVIEHTQPICCPCGPRRRVPSSCGSIFDKLLKGKPNTAHCLRFPGERFHVFGIGKRSIGFSIRIEVRKGSSVSEVLLGPENRTVLSKDNFLRVNLIGDFVGYTSIPSFEDFYLVTPRLGAAGQPDNLGKNFSTWMLLERVRFTLDGLECNKIGVGYEAYRGQPNFCSTPLWSCLHNQLWDFWESDMNRISRNQPPQYVIEGRFERINQHPNAGTHSFSVGVSEILNTNLLIELSADDIEYVYQRSPGKILSINVPTFEALTQFGTAVVTTKNIGQLEASYSLTFDCLKSVSYMEEQFFIMKPEEVVSRSFHIYPTTDQAGKYECAAILKASDFTEADRAGCQFTTTPTVLDNGSQITSGYESHGDSLNGFFGSIKRWWKRMWDGLIDFMTGKTCRSKCSSFFDFSCHMQYVCVSWILMFGLLLAIFPAVIILLWLLHQKGFFDPLHDWWDDRFGLKTGRTKTHSKLGKDLRQSHAHHRTGHHIHDSHARHRKDHHSHDRERLSGKKRSVHDRRALVLHRDPMLDLGDHRRAHAHKDERRNHRHTHAHGKSSKHGLVTEESSGLRGLRSVNKHLEEKPVDRKHGHDRDHRHKVIN
ncbi:Protein HAPLESS 2 [Platanthera zijinensis]|uniref:Protein HAPLESS 2 n=1 Tax=Platanthera zijinensis TaxID=2320716 RepID=A0AAP0GC07_9ASPA